MHVSPSRQKAVPFGEGVGLADGRGHCLPLWGRCRLCRRKRTFFPFGEGVGFADGRGHCDRKCPHSAELNESKNKKKFAPYAEYGISEKGCMWERCRPPMAIVIIGIKGDKEGQTSG